VPWRSRWPKRPAPSAWTSPGPRTSPRRPAPGRAGGGSRRRGPGALRSADPDRGGTDRGQGPCGPAPGGLGGRRPAPRVAGGPLRARTERGSILAVLAAEELESAARFERRAATSEVQFPARTDASVVLETQGALTTDFSLEVEHVGPLAKRARPGSAAVAARCSCRAAGAICGSPPAGRAALGSGNRRAGPRREVGSP